MHLLQCCVEKKWKTGNEKWKWKLEMETGNGNWKWKLEMETGNGNWKGKLKTEMETKNAPNTGAAFSSQTHEYCAL